MLPAEFQVKVKDRNQGRLVILALYLARGATVHGGGWEKGCRVFNKFFTSQHKYYRVMNRHIGGNYAHLPSSPVIEAGEVLAYLLPNLARLLYADDV